MSDSNTSLHRSVCDCSITVYIRRGSGFYLRVKNGSQLAEKLGVVITLHHRSLRGTGGGGIGL